MSKIKSSFFCQNCGYESAKWVGKCPSCNEWNTFVEELITKEKSNSQKQSWKENSGRGEGEVIQKDGVYETNLRDWSTEGQGTNNPEIKSSKIYSNINVGFPFGGGIRYYFRRLLTLSAEFNYYYFLTDYLDDVSNRYATYEELRASFPDEASFEMAKYISDPSGQGTYGFQKTASRRGNADVNDAFTYLSLEASYKITWKKRGIYGQ